MGAVIGIDLGTTNSCVATVEGSKPLIIPNAEGTRTTPSVVAFTDQGERLVGAVAQRQASVNPDNTITSIKRHMGTNWHKRIAGKDMRPQEISALILRKLKTDAEAYLGQSVTGAVITVPAYFNDSQRQATKDAGAIAGLEVLRIINEPTSATLAYGLDHGAPGKILVYDLGGGTFDVSVIEIAQDIIEVLATCGDNHLGGDDFDERVAEWMVDAFKRANGIDLRRDPAAWCRVKEAAEAAKKELSSAGKTRINLPFIASGKQGPLHLDMELSRSEFERMTADLLKRTEQPVTTALHDAGVKSSDLAHVLLVGGSTRMPAVREKVRTMLGKEPSSSVNPDEAVAIGAAIQAANLAGATYAITAASSQLLLVDVIPMSLSVEVSSGEASHVIEKNSTLPAHRSAVYTTAAPYQSSVEIRIIQGERPLARDNKLIGNFSLQGIRRAPAGVPQIEVTFDVGVDGILTVSAKDLDTGREQSIVITESDRMSQSEIDRARRDAEQYAAQDEMMREAVQAHRDAEILMTRVNTALKNAGKTIDKQEKKTIRSDLNSLERIYQKRSDKMSRADVDELKRCIDRLENSSAGLQ